MSKVIDICNKLEDKKRETSRVDTEKTILGLMISRDYTVTMDQMMAATSAKGNELQSVIEVLIHKKLISRYATGVFSLAVEHKTDGFWPNMNYRKQLITGEELQNHIHFLHEEKGQSLYGVLSEYCKKYGIMRNISEPNQISTDRNHYQIYDFNFENEEIVLLLKGKEIHFLGSELDNSRQIFTAKPLKSKESYIGLFYNSPLNMLGKAFHRLGTEDAVKPIYSLRVAR